uniref:Uncharacterized protein n=1 Tax=Meloidogyne hapla TaxID=6305 RepID=A0A1I8B767_MELHA
MSGPTVRIRRQRCFELPLECRRHLKKLVGGAELFTKPNHRIWGDFSSNNDKRVKENKKQNNLTKKLKKENNLLKTTNLPLNYGEEEFLLPLSQDKDILIPAYLLTTIKTTKQTKNNKKKNRTLKSTTSTKPISTKSQFTTKLFTTLKVTTQLPLRDLKSTTKFDKTLQVDFEMLYAEKQILDKNKLKNNNLSLKSPKNLQKIEIFGPPIKGPIPRASTPEDAFILHQPKLFQQNINKDNENILDNNKLKAPKIPPWWTWKKMAVQNEKKNNLEDFTNKCCQWALDGLCDRSWQRIRELWLFI